MRRRLFLEIMGGVAAMGAIDPTQLFALVEDNEREPDVTDARAVVRARATSGEVDARISVYDGDRLLASKKYESIGDEWEEYEVVLDYDGTQALLEPGARPWVDVECGHGVNYASWVSAPEPGLNGRGR